MISRIVCVGTGNRLTNPQAVHANNRIFAYPAPGEAIIHYQGSPVMVNREAEYPLSWRKEECDPRYGLMVIEDFLIKELRPKVMPVESALGNEFDNRLVMGDEMGKALAERWGPMGFKATVPNYGALLIQGEVPTEEELAQAQANRKKYALLRLQEVKRGQVLRMQGSRGFKAGYDRSDEAWAAEYGILLEIPLETAHTPPTSRTGSVEEDRVECPFCAELIMPKAKKCRFCSKTFKNATVAEYVAAEETMATMIADA